MIYIFKMSTGPWVCGTDPTLIKKLEPMRLVNTAGEAVEIRRVVNDSIFIAETNANQIAKNAEGDTYADFAELYAATTDLFFDEGEVVPESNPSKTDKIIITGVDAQTDYDMPVDTDMNSWIIALKSVEIDAVLVEVLGVKKIRFTEAPATGENVTVIYNKI